MKTTTQMSDARKPGFPRAQPSVSMRKRVFRFSLLLLSAISVTVAQAQPYPAKPVRIVVPFAAGGGIDTIGRTLAQKLTEAWGQSVIVDNRPGAGGLIGFESVLKAPADGYTLAIGTISTLTIIPLTRAKPPYDPLRDFAAVTMISTVPYVLAAHPSLPARNIGEFVKLARDRPAAISYSSAGIATGIHLTGEYFSRAANIKLTHVPYKGDAPALIDLAAGQITSGIFTTIVAGQHIRSGRIRGIALFAPQRSRELPEVPTAHESGLPGFESQSWQGISVRAGTPQPILRKLNADLVQILSSVEVRSRIESLGNTVSPGSPEEFEKFILSETAKWRKVIASAGIRID